MRHNISYIHCNLSILLVLSFTLQTAGANAEQRDSTARSFRIEEVQVVADQVDMRANAYGTVSTVSREQIAALPVSSVADILQYLPGLDLRKRGANGGQCDLSIRGGTFDQVQVLLNGIPINDAQTGHYSLHLPVSVQLIERIEVLPNGVNIVTHSHRLTGGMKGSVKLEAGMNAYCHPSAAGSWQSGEWLVNTSAEYSRSDGPYAPDPSPKEREGLSNNNCRWANAYVQTRWRELDIQLGGQYKDAGAGLFYGSSTDQFDATRTGFGSAKYKHRWGAWSLTAQASYRINYDHYEWHRGQTAGSNTHLLQTAGAGLQGAYISWLGTTSVGIEARNEHIRSTNLGDTNRVNLTYFARQTFHYDRLNASLELAGIYNTYFGNHYTCAANIGYEYHAGSSVYINASRDVRMPTFTDLKYDAGNQLGNKDLQPEKMWTVTIGGTYSYKGLSLSADAWYRHGTDIIDWVYVPTDSKRPYHAMNQQKINSAGTEISAIYTPAAISRQPIAQWIRQVKVSYGYTWLDLDLHEAQSRYLDYLSHKLVLGLEHGIWISNDPKGVGVLGASWNLRWQKREGDYTSAEGVTTAYQPVLLLDGSLYWQNERVKLSVSCTNITNRHYYDYGSLLMPGAWGVMGIEIRL